LIKLTAMKTAILTIAYAAALLVTPGVAIAQQSDQQASGCYNIASADARAYCLARAHRDPGRCYSIQAADLRQFCLAWVRQ